jgi:hypothetical protein
VKSELSENSETKWQIERYRTTKGATTKLYFPKDRLKFKINVTPNLTKMVTGHGNIKSYLYKYKIIDSSMCPWKIGEQTTDHILYDCELVKQERDKLKAEILRSENWPVTKILLLTNTLKFLKHLWTAYPLKNYRV